MGVFHVSQFFLLSYFCLFCLSFSSLPLLFDILKPKKVPTRWGLWHIYICLYLCFHLKTPENRRETWPKESHGIWLGRFQYGRFVATCGPLHELGGRFGYFLLFLLGGGEGAVRGARKGGVGFLLKIPGEGREGGGSIGPGGCPQGIGGGGGLNMLFRGRNSHQVNFTTFRTSRRSFRS